MSRLLKILSASLSVLVLGGLVFFLIQTLGSLQGEKAQPTTFQSPPLTPTETPILAPVLTSAGGIFDSPLPGPTATPMPELTEVKLAEIRLLTFDEDYPQGKKLKELMELPSDWPYETNGSFNVLGWATPSELVVQPVIPYTKKHELPIWALNVHNGKVHPLPDWKYGVDLNQAAQGIVNSFLAQSQHKPDKVRSHPSPNGKFLAIATVGEPRSHHELRVYPVVEADSQLPLLNAYGNTSFPPVWSADGNKIAYGIAVYRPGYPEVSYEVHIGDLTQDSVISIASPYYEGYSNDLTWSPDGKYIAFIAQRGDHEPLTLYVVRTDATAIVNLMPEEEDWGLDFVFWSPSGDYIAFGSYGRNIWLARVMIEN